MFYLEIITEDGETELRHGDYAEIEECRSCGCTVMVHKDRASYLAKRAKLSKLIANFKSKYYSSNS